MVSSGTRELVIVRPRVVAEGRDREMRVERAQTSTQAPSTCVEGRRGGERREGGGLGDGGKAEEGGEASGRGRAGRAAVGGGMRGPRVAGIATPSADRMRLAIWATSAATAICRHRVHIERSRAEKGQDDSECLCGR